MFSVKLGSQLQSDFSSWPTLRLGLRCSPVLCSSKLETSDAGTRGASVSYFPVASVEMQQDCRGTVLLTVWVEKLVHIMVFLETGGIQKKCLGITLICAFLKTGCYLISHQMLIMNCIERFPCLPVTWSFYSLYQCLMEIDREWATSASIEVGG